MIDFNVIDSGANLSDHLVLQLMCTYNSECVIGDNVTNDMCPTATHLRWDHAALSEYYCQTGRGLQCILADIVSFEERKFLSISPEGAVEYILVNDFINITYNDVLNVLFSCAKKSFLLANNRFTRSGGPNSWIF